MVLLHQVIERYIKILETIKKYNGKSSNQIFEYSSIRSKETFQRVINDLEKLGLIEREEKKPDTSPSRFPKFYKTPKIVRITEKGIKVLKKLKELEEVIK